MTAKTFLLLLITSLLISSYGEEISDEIKNLEDSEENIEDTTLHSEEYDEFRTTTQLPQDDEVKSNRFEHNRPMDEDIKNRIDDLVKKELEARAIQSRDEGLLTDESYHKIDKEESVENMTDAVEITPSSLNNDVDEQSNLTNNILAMTETIPVQTTTKALEDESVLQNPKDMETSGPRIAKSDNDPERSYTQGPPQSTRSIVRGWLDDTWIRSPVGILVPLRATALNRALAVWTDLNTSTLNLSRVCFMAYDENGISWRSKHSLHPTSYGNHDKTVTEALSKLLLKYQAIMNVDSSDSRADGTMRALTGAAKLVPYDSALFVITDEGPGDMNRLQLALRAVVEKRLKVYTLWTNPNYPDAETDEGLLALKNISQHTEGDVIPYPLQVIDIDASSNLAELEQWSYLYKQGRRPKLFQDTTPDKFDLLVVRRGAGQVISLGVPVENGVTALRIFIEGAVEHAVLYPPNDALQIDLYNVSSVSAFSPSSRTEGLSPRDVHLVFPGNTFDFDTLSVLPAYDSAFVGMWHLSVRCDTCDYRLCFSAKTLIHFDAVVETANTLKLRVSGPVASVRESQLVDEYGTELAKLTFSYQPMAGDGQNLEYNPNFELVADVALPPVKASKIYTKIVGRDVRGQPFVRLSGPLVQPEVRLGRSAAIVFPDSLNDLERAEEFNSRAYNNQFRTNDSDVPLSRISQIINQQGTLLTTVQIGLASRLHGNPGDRLQLHFEVTNFREQSVRFDFGAVGEMRFLTGINPTSQIIPSGQTVNVIVSLTIPTTAQPGARDTITFTAYGNEQLSMSAYISVSNAQATIDTWAPEMRHIFQGTCLGRTGDDCALHTWAVTVIARDPGAGLLRLSSSPIGLIYNEEFTSGTREEVIATYRATCCAPRLLVSAVDAVGNANSYTIDISWYLTETAIAAIVLGVFLAIALIVLLILLIYWCVKKRRETRELPNFNTRS
ncbi:unnamed protein product [Arctia plantaginis]|uniref:VWA7 Ig-like domain-containing protein n=1 Tax=Arctia plantaginis TaxID=874455 RepID=A0A8S1BEN5_ARCPL|nr:unnamed protein product [Arctia plantaginis]